MIIRKVRADRFGRLVDLELDFQPGLNVVKGPNEAGKSTLQKAILMALFERPNKKKSTEAYRSWGHELLYTLEIEFQDMDGNLWQLSKDFENNQLALSSGTDDQWVGFHKIAEKVTDVLGTTSEKMFRSTVFVAQDTMPDLTDGEKEISLTLEGIVTGGEQDVNTQKAISKLAQTIKALGRGYQDRTYSSPGPIKRLLDEKEQLEKTLREQRQALASRDQLVQSSDTTKSRLTELSNELDAKSALLRYVEGSETLKTELATCQKQESELERTVERIESAQKELDAAKANHAKFGPLASLSPADRAELTESEQKRRKLLEAAHAAPSTNAESVIQAVSTAPSKPETSSEVSAKRQGGHSKRAGGLIIAAGLALVALGVSALSQNPLQGVVIGGGTVLAIIGLLLVIRNNRNRPDSAQNTDLVVPVPGPVNSTPATKTSPEKETTRDELEALQTRIAAKLNSLGCADWSEYLQKVAELDQAATAMSMAETKLTTLLDNDKALETIRNDRMEKSRRRRDIQETLAIPELVNADRLTPLERQTLRIEVDRLVKEKDRLKEEAVRQDIKLETSGAPTEEILKAEETLSSLENELERAQARLESYQLTQKYLEQAREETLVRARDQLGPQTGDYLSVLTLGKYNEVKIGPNLEISVLSQLKDDGIIDPADLSKGTQDQLYLAARFALADLLFPNTKPPFFLDDPFVKFDPIRRKAAAQLCVDIAHDRQVFLFTCHDDYDDLGHLVELS